MSPFRLPRWNSPEVGQTAAYLLSLSASDSSFHLFLRDYLSSNLTRIAMNLVVLRRLIKPGDSYLDVGSFGIEPAIIQMESPSCVVKALSYEGNRIGIGPQGLQESKDPYDHSAVTIEKIDVERQRFPYADNSFDLVTCFEVLEHLKFSPVPMVKEIKRVLKPTGSLVLTTPNINCARSMVKMVCGWSPQECPYFHDSLEYGVIHPKEYTLEQVRDLFSCLGFDLQTLGTIDMRPTNFSDSLMVILLSLIIFFPRRFLNRPTFKTGLREKIWVMASKGGPIISERPSSIFAQTF